MLSTKTGQLNVYIRVYGLDCSPVSLVGQFISNLQVTSLWHTDGCGPHHVVCQMSGLLLEVRLSLVSKTSGLRLHV